MRSVLLLHAERDAPPAREPAASLYDGAVSVQVFLDEGRLAPGESLVAKAPEGLMADALVVVVSNASAPAQWRRDEWDPALWTALDQAGVATAVLVAGPCRSPEFPRRRDCFDAQPGRLAAFGELKSRLLASQTDPQQPAFAPASAPWFQKRAAELDELRRRAAEAQQRLQAAHQVCAAAGRHRQVGELARESRWICSNWNLEEQARKYRWCGGMAQGAQSTLPF